MKINTDTDKTVQSLIDLKKGQILQVNHEYQRAPVWKPHQEQMFIDSIFRGYSIPAFYLHHEKKTVGNFSVDALSIIDGQQRINALYKYYEGAFPLLDPEMDATFKFPNFVKGENCPWATKRYKDLDPSLQEKFLNQSVVIYNIETSDKNKIRDLFIRLQGGTPLTAQEKRDSWPGKFTEYVLNLGGKHGVDRYPGHEFFIKTAKPTGNESNRRKVAAQIAMLYFHKREKGALCDIKAVNIDQFYHQKIDFDTSSEDAQRFEKILKILVSAFQGSKPLKSHYAIGLVLLADNLLDDYVTGWETKLRSAFDKFSQQYLASAKAMQQDNVADDYYNLYVQWSSNRTDVAVTIRRRHYFFVEKMLQFINPQPKDSQRSFTDTQREIIFHRDKHICQVCKMRGDLVEVAWDDVEIHHVNEHKNGGLSILENGALVHKECHPKTKEHVAAFRRWWESKEDDDTDEKIKQKFPPEGTACRFRYSGHHYEGTIAKKKLVVDQHGTFDSFSAASCGLTGTNRNGWRDWNLRIPGQQDWVLADDWRSSQLN